jgi:hypothetical protein
MSYWLYYYTGNQFGGGAVFNKEFRDENGRVQLYTCGVPFSSPINGVNALYARILHKTLSRVYTAKYNNIHGWCETEIA